MHQESRIIMGRVSTIIVPRAGTTRIEIIVLMKRPKLAGVRVQKWIPNDPRNERTCAHMWRKMGSGGPWEKVPKQKIAEHQRASR